MSTRAGQRRGLTSQRLRPGTQSEAWGEIIKLLSAGGIMALGIAIYFLAAVIPGAVTNFFAANTTTWSTSTVALWGLIPLAIIALIVFFFVPHYEGRKGE